MIGLMVVGVIVGYILLAKFIVTKVYEKTQSLKKKYIALAIVILIPTWDAILGLPIYMYLCKYHAGVKIYQTVDNVEGFYVGERSSAYDKIPPLPYKGYRFIDYKERRIKSNEPYKYYRVSWVDANTTSECIQIGNGSDEYDLNLYKQGKCVVKEEIAESDIGRWEFYGYSTIDSEIPILGIKKEKLLFIKDKLSKKIIGEVDDVWWDAGYIIGRIFIGWNSSMEPKGLNYMDGKFSYEDVLKNILKPKGDK